MFCIPNTVNTVIWDSLRKIFSGIAYKVITRRVPYQARLLNTDVQKKDYIHPIYHKHLIFIKVIHFLALNDHHNILCIEVFKLIPHPRWTV